MTSIAIGLAVIAAWSTPAGAQSKQPGDDQRVRVETRNERRIVISREIIEEIRRVIDTAVGEVRAREIGREIGRQFQDVAGDVSREIARARIAASSAIQNRDFKIEQTDRQTKTLAIGAAGELLLKNVAGDITVKAGGGREATVEIVRVSRGRTDADAKLGLERVTAEVSVRGERGSVIAQYSDDRRPNYSVSVAYTVTTPAGTRLTVDTIAGQVRVAGLQGELHVGGVSGAVEISSCSRAASVKTIAGGITLTDVQSPGHLEVGSVSSTIRLTGIKAQRLTVSLVSGAIVAREIQADAAALDTTSGGIEYSGSLSARGRYEFRAFSGNVRLGLTGGFDLEMKTFSGRVEADPSLGLTPTLKAGAQSQRSLQGVAGNGGAAVVASTFSGNVWVGRKLN